jgi:hypothetical protein
MHGSSRPVQPGHQPREALTRARPAAPSPRPERSPRAPRPAIGEDPTEAAGSPKRTPRDPRSIRGRQQRRRTRWSAADDDGVGCGPMTKWEGGLRTRGRRRCSAYLMIEAAELSGHEPSGPSSPPDLPMPLRSSPGPAQNAGASAHHRFRAGRAGARRRHARVTPVPLPPASPPDAPETPGPSISGREGHGARQPVGEARVRRPRARVGRGLCCFVLPLLLAFALPVSGAAGEEAERPERQPSFRLDVDKVVPSRSPTAAWPRRFVRVVASGKNHLMTKVSRAGRLEGRPVPLVREASGGTHSILFQGGGSEGPARGHGQDPRCRSHAEATPKPTPKPTPEANPKPTPNPTPKPTSEAESHGHTDAYPTPTPTPVAAVQAHTIDRAHPAGRSPRGSPSTLSSTFRHVPSPSPIVTVAPAGCRLPPAAVRNGARRQYRWQRLPTAARAASGAR